MGPRGLLGVAVVSFGGPLALAALYAPGIVVDATGSAGLVTVAAAAVFLLPLGIWLAYARRVSGGAGLTGFVEAAVGRRVALVQAGVWTFSYVLYLLYTSAYIVYDVLPAAVPGITAYRPFLAVALPVLVAAAALAPSRVTVVVIGTLAVTQVVLTAMLAALAMARGVPASSIGPHGHAASVAVASGNVALLFVCGSLPLFFGADVARPTQVMRRAVLAGYAVAVLSVAAVVVPLDSDPAFARADVPGVAFADVAAGHAAGVAVGVGVAGSIAAVMLVEYLAVARLAHAVTGWPLRRLTRGLAVLLVAAAPVSLLDPDRFYTGLLRPSLVALWVAQLIPVAVFPWFARRAGRLTARTLAAAVGASALMVFGLYSSIVNQVAT